MFEDLGEPTHTFVSCWIPKPLSPRNHCTGWFVPAVFEQLAMLLLDYYSVLSMSPCHVAKATLNMIFSVTYYLESHNVIIGYCPSHYFTNKVRIDCLDIIEQ